MLIHVGINYYWLALNYFHNLPSHVRKTTAFSLLFVVNTECLTETMAVSEYSCCCTTVCSTQKHLIVIEQYWNDKLHSSTFYVLSLQ